MDSPFTIILLVFMGLGTAVFLGLNKMAAGDVCDGATYKATTASGVKVIGGKEKRDQLIKLNKKCFDDVKRPTATGLNPSSAGSASSYSYDNLSGEPSPAKRKLEPVESMSGGRKVDGSSN